MARLHIGFFSGMVPEMDARLLPKNAAQVAHNCELDDGVLRPMPDWVEVYKDSEYVGVQHESIRGITVFAALREPVLLSGTPFASGIAVGIDRYDKYASVAPLTDPHNTSGAAIEGEVNSSSVTYERSYDSDKPVNRLYAVSFVRKLFGTSDEGPLHVLPGQYPTDVLYEGDLVTVQVNADPMGATHMRIYRTITGMDTGEVVTNELDTEWHLVTEEKFDYKYSSKTIVYIDGNSATALPLDVYYSGDNFGLTFDLDFFGLTESGYFIAANKAGKIAISERFKFHAWPEENYFDVPETITAAKVVDDNVYIGTLGRPYVMAVSQGEKSAQGALRPYQETIPCLPDTMSPSPGGVLYSSKEGVVSLTRDGLTVLSSDTLRMDTKVGEGYVFYGEDFGNPQKERANIAVNETTFATYFSGKYYGIMKKGPPSIGT